MRTFKFITFTADPPPRSALRRMLAGLGISERTDDLKEFDGVYFLRLPATDPRLGPLTAALNAMPFDLPWSFQSEAEYNRADLEACEFVSLDIDRAPKGDADFGQGTEYDPRSGCPACGTGAVQTSPLRLSPSSLPKSARAMRTYQEDILVDRALAAALIEELGSDRGLRQAQDRRTHAPLPWWQIVPDEHLPPADPATGFTTEKEQCPRCRRDGFCGPPPEHGPSELVYRMTPAKRRRLGDFVSTWEHGGLSRLKPVGRYVASLARPSIVVSNRVMRVFWAWEAKEAVFTPVRFLG